MDENREEWPLRFVDGTAQFGLKSSDNIIRLRNYFREKYLSSFFKNENELAKKVLAAVFPVIGGPEPNPPQKNVLELRRKQGFCWKRRIY